jgi:DNA-binding transcriptional LysR family regulator
MQNPYDLRDRGLPSIKALIAFEATVRLGSMTAAARELDSTQPAISQRIRQLEDTLGALLFDRTGGRVATTEAGRRLYEDVSNALQALESAVRQYKTSGIPDKRKVTIAAHFGFAHVWLLPRMTALETAFPHLHFEITPVDLDDAPEMAQADLAIRFGRVKPDEKNERLLMNEFVFPICSPSFASKYLISEVVTETQLSTVPLLHLDRADPRWLDWEQWSRLAHLPMPVQKPRIRYNNYPLLLNAVKEGFGLALGWSVLVEQAIKDGTMVAIGPSVERKGYGYICRSRFLDNAVIAPVAEWLAATMNDGRPSNV